ncbi:hypothetical protein F4604DRAFT_1677448 [Suillus subluteus]|nr:hypothetical protein F4604DRAFT_1677448 [Suillus subluteus]
MAMQGNEIKFLRPKVSISESLRVLESRNSSLPDSSGITCLLRWYCDSVCELQDLTTAEEMMIALCRTKCFILHLREESCHVPNAQRGLKAYTPEEEMKVTQHGPLWAIKSEARNQMAEGDLGLISCCEKETLQNKRVTMFESKLGANSMSALKDLPHQHPYPNKGVNKQLTILKEISGSHRVPGMLVVQFISDLRAFGRKESLKPLIPTKSGLWYSNASSQHLMLAGPSRLSKNDIHINVMVIHHPFSQPWDCAILRVQVHHSRVQSGVTV